MGRNETQISKDSHTVQPHIRCLVPSGCIEICTKGLMNLSRFFLGVQNMESSVLDHPFHMEHNPIL